MKLLFIGSRLYDDVDYYVREKNIESILTESNKEAINLDLPDEVIIVPRGMDEPKKIAIERKVDAVVPLIGIDPPLMDVAIMKEELEEKYGIPVIASNVESVRLTSNKIKTKKFFKDEGITTPDYQIIKNSDELKLDFPVVLKQGEGQGGKDIKIAKEIDDVNEYFNTFNQALCERFVEGYEISIEVLSYKGEVVPLEPVYKGETTLEGTHPINKLKSGPLSIDGLDNETIKKTAYKIAKALNSDGIFEMDFIYSKKGEVFAIEVNTRPNGTRYLTNGTCNINSLHEIINMAIGEFSKQNIERKMKSYFAVEIPIGNYKGRKHNLPLKSFGGDNFIVHGPKGYERITIRAESKDKLDNLVDDLIN